MTPYFDYSTAVMRARSDKQPILALESTVITHGLPYPQNIETAHALEKIANDHGVIPATIAIMGGKIKIGLSEQELETLANDKHAAKASRRDIPVLLNQQLNAGTTVASTLFCAHRAGIAVFATGGIGGVHRGDDQDVSADLIELARTPMAIVCAGAKSILDLPKTLEFLETFSIPIVGYRTDTLPAFYTAQTTYKLPTRIDDIATLAALFTIHLQLGMTSGIVITNPIPAEHEIPADVIEPIIQNALAQAAQMKLSGNKVTPFLLSEVVNTTQGKSLQANIELIKNNVKLGAMLSNALTT